LPSEFSVPLVEWRHISGGVLIQDADHHFAGASEWTQVAGPEVNSEVLRSLEFAWRAVRSVKSNAILLAQGLASVGIGMGQVNRVDSARLAVERAGEKAQGSVAASDAFFPFADGLEILLKAGVVAIVQPGGSLRDDEVIQAAQEAGVAMFFTGGAALLSLKSERANLIAIRGHAGVDKAQFVKKTPGPSSPCDHTTVRAEFSSDSASSFAASIANRPTPRP